MKPWTERKLLVAALRNEGVVAREVPGMGRGLFAARAFSSGEPVASYRGRVYAREELGRIFKSDRGLFERISEYGVGTPSGGHLYADEDAPPGAQLINHSCGPNTCWAEFDRERSAIVMRADRPIAEGEEITAHYGWVGTKAAVEKSWHPCRCSAPYCCKTIELKFDWEVYGDGTAGPNLSPVEVCRRFFADIVNDTGEHEALLHRYAASSFKMVVGAEVVAKMDMEAYLDKLILAARVAVRSAFDTEDGRQRRSDRRLRQIARSYEAEDLLVGRTGS